MKRVSFCLVILSLVAPSTHARRFASGPLELVTNPARASEATKTYRLLPGTDKQVDVDAVPLYEKALQALPRGRTQTDQIHAWSRLPLEQLPQEQVEEVIQKHGKSLALLAQATQCKQCNWPKWKPGTPVPDQSEYRSLASLLRLQIRLAVVHGQYDKALRAMQTGFGMAKHIGKGPTTTQAMVGSAIGSVMCQEVEGIIKGKNTPNLYWALAHLPRPLVNVENAIESELANLKDYNILMRKAFRKQLKPSHDRILFFAKRLDTNLNALQCVEALRHYAATHNGQLPEKLSLVSDLTLPIDVMSNKAFGYQRTATGAVLQSAVPEEDERDVIRYEVVLKE